MARPLFLAGGLLLLSHADRPEAAAGHGLPGDVGVSLGFLDGFLRRFRLDGAEERVAQFARQLAGLVIDSIGMLRHRFGPRLSGHRGRPVLRSKDRTASSSDALSAAGSSV